jgi:hypothetical protein
VSPRFRELKILVFSAAQISGRKVATHEHLARIAGGQVTDPRSDLVAELSYQFAEGMDALERGDSKRLGEAWNGYAQALWRAGLEAGATHEDRRALAALPGVLGVKGTGAMQADAIVVLLDQAASADSVTEQARSRGLKLVSNALPGAAGLTREEA